MVALQESKRELRGQIYLPERLILPGAVEWREEGEILPEDEFIGVNILVRHLPTDLNKAGAMQGPGNLPPVTDIIPELIEETLKKRHLTRFDTPRVPRPTRIKTSTSGRTYQSAVALAEHHGWPLQEIEITEDSRLEERSQGKLSHKTSHGQAQMLLHVYPEYVQAYLDRLRNSPDEAERQIGSQSVQDFLFPGDNLESFGAHIGKMIDDPYFHVGDGGETLLQVGDRVRRVFEESVQEKETTLVVTHAGVLVSLGMDPGYLGCITSHKTPNGDYYLARRSGLVL